MTDRELLELAAKAAGYIVAPGQQYEDGGLLAHDGSRPVRFSPLTDDGDALRLAVALGLRVESRLDGQAYVWLGERLLWNEFALDHTSVCERTLALCRAITRAAAEIGRAME